MGSAGQKWKPYSGQYSRIVSWQERFAMGLQRSQSQSNHRKGEEPQMRVYIVEILVGKRWEPTGPNWWFTKGEAMQAKRAFSKIHADQKYRVGGYRGDT